MLKTFAITAIVAFGSAAPVWGQEATPHQFAETVADAISYLTIPNETQAFTRDAQLGDGAFGPGPNLSGTASGGAFEGQALATEATAAPRTQVFRRDETVTSRRLNGFQGFGGAGFGRIDR